MPHESTLYAPHHQHMQFDKDEPPYLRSEKPSNIVVVRADDSQSPERGAKVRTQASVGGSPTRTLAEGPKESIADLALRQQYSDFKEAREYYKN